ncbi:hypothetical protein VIM7927_03266 [Vibrio mangrovi]|uniref:Uncharacterized protein n=1 Tax=Vibrio mangrovi TaxID=474394 RepID=A0A1Y6IWA3_9VIBR|nr:hypothetical protein VIM7927_03266 [Vibrio mangrovi]
MSMAIKHSYLNTLAAQVQCINEQLSGVKRERLSLVNTDHGYRIEKMNPSAHNSTILFQGKGRACHVFLNGYQSFFFTE